MGVVPTQNRQLFVGIPPLSLSERVHKGYNFLSMIELEAM